MDSSVKHVEFHCIKHIAGSKVNGICWKTLDSWRSGWSESSRNKLGDIWTDTAVHQGDPGIPCTRDNKGPDCRNNVRPTLRFPDMRRCYCRIRDIVGHSASHNCTPVDSGPAVQDRTAWDTVHVCSHWSYLEY